MFSHFSVFAQNEEKLKQEKITKLYIEILKNLANRKDNLEQNGPLISIPRFTNSPFRHIDSFIKDGGLKELPDSSEWLFLKKIDFSTITEHQNFEYKKIRKLLLLQQVTLSKNKGLSNGLSTFIFNGKGDKVCFTCLDYFSTSPGPPVITDKVVVFYEWKDDGWEKIMSLPLVLN